MKFCFFPANVTRTGLGLDMALKITSLQTKQQDSVLEMKPLNVQNKGIFYILRLLPSSSFQHCTTTQGCNLSP